MGRHAEAIGRRRFCRFWHKPGAGKFAKRLLARAWRRWAKQDPAGAPVRPPTKGWGD